MATVRGMMSMHRFLSCLLCLILLLLNGCYHLRLEPTPLETLTFTVSDTKVNLFKAVQRALKKDGFFLEMEDRNNSFIQTRYRFFYKATGSGQPDGGRDYYCKLKVLLRPTNGGAEIILEAIDLEMRSFYVYDQNQNIHTMGKRYPYLEYPGMFDLPPVQNELVRVKELLSETFAKARENMEQYGTDGF